MLARTGFQSLFAMPRARRTAMALGALGMGWALLMHPAIAQDGAAQLSQIGQRFVDEAMHQVEPASAGSAGAAGATEAKASPLRMEVQVGQIDSRLRLAACAKVEPYLPAGSRLWGRTRLGLRCLQGAVGWNVFLPVTVKAYGPAWVVQGSIPTGKALSAEDAILSEVDWAEENAPVYANAQDWVGMVATRPLASGQALRQNMLRPPALFAAGAQVQVLVNGGSFSIASSGKAMTAAGEGQPVRVRMDNGRLVSGTVSADGVVWVQ